MFPDLIENNILYLNDRHEEKDTGQEDRRKIYDKRILSLLDKNDLVIFGEKIDPFLWDYYRNLGLSNIDKNNIFYVNDYLNYPSLTKALINDKRCLDEIKKKKPELIIPYVESENTQTLARRIGSKILRSAETVERFNNKSDYRSVMNSLEFPMIPGFRAGNLKEAKEYFTFLKKRGFQKIALKKERSVAGFGIFVVQTEPELERKIKKFLNKQNFLVEAFIDNVIFSPNVQYWIGKKKISSVTVSDQSMREDKVSHKGNIFPSRLYKMPDIWKKIEELSYRLCDYLQKQRCYGLVGIDYLVTRDKKIFSTEANVRLNASTFAALIADKLFENKNKISWRFFGIQGRPLPFEDIFNSARQIFVNQKEDFGVFPIDVGLLSSMGEGQFLAIGPSMKKVNNYVKKLNQIYEDLF